MSSQNFDIEDINVYQCIAESFQNCGYSCNTNGEYFEFSPLNLFIDARIEEITSAEDELLSCRLLIKSTQLSLFPLGIVEYGYGWGNTAKDCVINAMQRWIQSDFAPIHDYLCKKGAKKNMELLSFSEESGETLAWHVYLGPPIEIDLNGTRENEERRLEVFKLLFNPITGDLLCKKGIYPIRCFLSKHGDGIVDVDCRVNGEDWQGGKNELYEHTLSWPANNYLVALKQYMLIVPTQLDQIESKTLLNQLDREVKKQLTGEKKWWQFWK
jgi:hypothetical protein